MKTRNVLLLAMMYSCCYYAQEPSNAPTASCTLNLSSGLLAKYDFTGNANDLSGNGYNGTVSNVTLTLDRFGNPGSAFSFNGINSHIDVGNPLGTVTTDFTITYWFNQSANNNGIIISKKAAGSWANGLWQVSTDLSTSAYNYCLPNNYLSGCALFNPSISSGWHFGALIHTSTSDMFYLDTTVISNAMSSPVTQAPVDVLIGDRLSYDYPFSGFIDDIRIYNRALTGCEIDSLFTLPNPTAGINSEKQKEVKVALYPNPSSDFVHVDGIEKFLLVVYNSSGERVLSKENCKVIDCRVLPKGLYVFQIHSLENGAVISKRVTIQ